MLYRVAEFAVIVAVLVLAIILLSGWFARLYDDYRKGRDE